MKSTPANNPPKPEAVADIIAYHDRTKHHPERYANGPGGLDWANQPNPFRHFTGARVLRLPLAGPDDTPPCGYFVRRGDSDLDIQFPPGMAEELNATPEGKN